MAATRAPPATSRWISASTKVVFPDPDNPVTAATCMVPQRTICAMSRIVAAFFLLVSLTGAYTDAFAATAAEPPKMTITSEPLGDSGQAVVIRFTFRFGIPQDVPDGIPLIISA